MDKKFFAKIFSIVLTVVFVLTIGFTANAEQVSGAPRGDSVVTPYSEYPSVEEQLIEMLSECSTSQERKMIMKKAYQLNIDESAFDGVTLNSEERTLLRKGEEKVSSYSVNTVNRKIITAPTSYSRIARDSVAGVDMPDYVLSPSIFWQEQSDYCSAATIVIVSDYLGANTPTQAEIMSHWVACGAKYPDLPMMRNYLNNTLTGKPDNYVKYVVKQYNKGDQKVFNTALKNNVLNYQPMIILMKSKNTSQWPYITDGHFCVCNGLLTWEDNQYFIGDPYYWTKYLTDTPKIYGKHKVSWKNLDDVIGNRFQGGTQYFLT